MNVLQFLRNSLSFLRPFQSDTFFGHYLQTIELIKANDPQTVSQQACLIISLIYCSLHFLYQALAPLSDVQRILHCDALSFIMIPKFNFLGPPFYGSLLYYIYKMNFTYSEVNNTLLSGLLLQGEAEFFLNPKTADGRFIARALKAKMRLVYLATQWVVVVYGKPSQSFLPFCF